MSFTFTTDLVGTASLVLYSYKELLKTAGWTIPRSSDATTYNSTGDQITTSSSGAGGLNNSSAWFVIKQPNIDGYQREFCFQRSTFSVNWRIKYSHSAGFTGGSPDATHVPSATDEVILLGSGTDASPTFNTFIDNDTTYRATIFCGDADERYVFYIMSWTSGGTNPKGNLIFDSFAANSFSPLDIDPYTIFCPSTGNALLDGSNYFNASSSVGPRAWWRKGYSNENFAVANAVYGNSSSSWIPSGSSGLGVNAWNGQDDGLPCIYVVRGPSSGQNFYGLKGISKNISLAAVNRSVGDTLSVMTSNDRIYYGNLILPWNGTLPTL